MLKCSCQFIRNCTVIALHIIQIQSFLQHSSKDSIGNILKFCSTEEKLSKTHYTKCFFFNVLFRVSMWKNYGKALNRSTQVTIEVYNPYTSLDLPTIMQ